MSSSKRRIAHFLKENNEFWGIPLGIILFLVTPSLIQAVDPTAAAFDAGVLHALLFALAAVFIIKGAVWLMLWADFPDLYKYLDNLFTKEFRSESPARPPLALAVYFMYFLALVILTAALL